MFKAFSAFWPLPTAGLWELTTITMYSVKALEKYLQIFKKINKLEKWPENITTTGRR